jgi:D-sedoheptulose 7-phosphate isomerase
MQGAGTSRLLLMAHSAESLLTSNIAASISTLQSLAAFSGPLAKAATLLSDCLLNGHTLLTCGNGGSAADGGHIATEFVARFDSGRDRRPYPAICLSDSASTLTAIANDFGFEHIFARQVHAFAKAGDLLIAISTSGKSRNIALALEAAREVGIASVALLGKGGGVAKGLATVELIVPSNVTARVQESHLLLYHTLCEAVDDLLLARERKLIHLDLPRAAKAEAIPQAKRKK